MEHLKNLMRPERESLMPKEPVLSHLEVRLGSRVADVGAGLGWLTFPLAIQVGPAGRVYAIDPSQDGISAIRGEARAESLGQIEAVLARAERTPLQDGEVDRIVWHTMYHDVQDRDQALLEMTRILKPGGLWVIVDWEKRQMEMGPPLEVRVTADTVIAEVSQTGMLLRERWQAGPVTWGLTFEKP